MGDAGAPLFGLGRLTRAGEEFETAGYVHATDQEAQDGNFGVGGGREAGKRAAAMFNV